MSVCYFKIRPSNRERGGRKERRGKLGGKEEGERERDIHTHTEREKKRERGRGGQG